ncbi:MAG: HAD-IA family hydrolase [bacterium]
MKQVVIFDFDGTLADSIGLAVRLYNQYAEQFGADTVEESELPGLRQAVRDLGYTKAMKLKNIRLSRLPAMVLTISKEMRSHMSEVKPYDGIIEALENLKAKGYRLGVLTSNQEHLVREFLETHQYPLFDFIISEKTLFGKDKALKRIIKKFALDKRGVVYVGDETRDTVACKKADIDVIGVSWGVAGPDGFKKSPPTVLIDSPYKLFDTVQNL